MSALLRTASFPGAIWLAGSNPGLFELVRTLVAAEAEYRFLARTLAQRIGRELVPDLARSGRDRGWTLAQRRRLHTGGALPSAAADRLAALAAEGDDARPRGLAAEIHAVRARADRLAAERERVSGAIATEERRLLELPWELARAVPDMALAMRQADPALFADIQRRLAGDEPWTTKRMRRRSDLLWRLIDRGATKPTPRAWFAQVALVPVRDVDATTIDLAVTGETACQWVENLHHGRSMLLRAGLENAPDATLLTVTPLHWYEDHSLVAWVTTVDKTVTVTEVRLRRTPLLESICTTLHSGARSLGAVQAAIAPAADAPGRAVLRRFLGYLAGIGIVEVCQPPRVVRSGWDRPERHPEPASDGYLDAYRRAGGVVPLTRAADLESATQQVLRVLGLIYDDAAPARAARRAEIPAEPRSVLAILRQRIEAAEHRVPHGPAHGSGWPAAQTEGSGYARLLAWLDRTAQPAAGRASTGGGQPSTVELTSALLDSFGAPAGVPAWPLDCLLRLLPGSGPAAALDALYPAGILDARFVDALEALSGPVPHVDAYRQFLRRVEELTGYLFVEVLVPPLSIQAANAVRRPRYTSAWTGDADLQTYCGPGGPAGYIPLDAIMVSRSGGRTVATVDGRRIWPVHHATRSALPPWDMLVALLLSTAPRPVPYASMANLRGSLDALPHRGYLPRITTGNLVISAAQWRIGRVDLWQHDEPVLAKVRALDALRERLNMPRWVLLAGPVDGSGVYCDLESLRSVRAFDRVLDGPSASVRVVEALPAPPDYPVSGSHAPGSRMAAQLMLRLPVETATDDLAVAAAQALTTGPVTAAGHDSTGRGRREVNA